MTSDVLNAAIIEDALTSSRFGRPCFYFDRLGSTNDWLLAHARQDSLPEGTVAIAGFQHQGKGRHRRAWEAPADSSLLLSLLFRPPWPPDRAIQLLMLGSLALQTAIASHTTLAAGLKWPNDLVIESDGRLVKLAGLLLESDLSAAPPLYVLGLGLNVNIPAERLPAARFPATSLQVALGRPVPRLPLLATLLAEVERRYDAAVDGRSPHAEWSAALVTIGRDVSVTRGDGAPSLVGRATGVAADGRLLVADARGQTHAVAAGDVTLAGQP